MNPYSLIALASMGISLLTFIVMQLGMKHTVKTDLIDELEKRITALERELKTCEDHIKALEQENSTLMKENIALLRKVARMDNGIPPVRRRGGSRSKTKTTK
jgi:regulator of replication initiation timing